MRAIIIGWLSGMLVGTVVWVLVMLAMPEEECPPGMRLTIGRGFPECVWTRGGQ